MPIGSITCTRLTSFASKLFLILLLIFIFLSSPNPTLAAISFNIESIDPTSISSKSDEISVNLSISELTDEYYLRVAWQKLSGGAYFGYVKNNSGEWVKIESINNGCSQYYKLSDSDITSVTLVTKIGEDTEDILPDTYLLKAHRSTSSGNCNSTASNGIEITVNIPSPTPTPTNTPTPEPTPRPTNTPKPPTNTPKPKNTAKPTAKPTAKITAKQVSPQKSGSVLGKTAKPTFDIFLPTSSPSASPTAQLNEATKSAGIKTMIGYLFIVLGAIALAGAGFSAYNIYKER